MLVNGSMWTIGYEFRCYLLVAVLRLLLASRPMRQIRAAYLLIALGLFAPLALPSLRVFISWNHFWSVLGEPISDLRLIPVFFLGSSFFF